MLLAIDIGNTSINLGLFKENRLAARFLIPTASKTFLPQLKKIFARNKIKDAIICSVVPKAAKIIEGEVKNLLGKQPLVLGRGITVPIKNLYKNPCQVGQDRLVAAFAASKIYGFPVVVVDFGTATTFDVVSKNGAYLGGVIFPGIGMSADALHERTALLPKVRFKKPGRVIGKNTQESILSGLFYGFGSLVDGLIARISQQLPSKIPVVFTGGFAKAVKPHSRLVYKVDAYLVLKGLQLIYSQKVT